MKRLLAAALVALGALVPAVGWSEEAPRNYVVLLLPEHETPTSRRLKAEVSKLDLAVHVAQTDEPVDPDEPRMAELAQTFGGEALPKHFRNVSVRNFAKVSTVLRRSSFVLHRSSIFNG